MLCWSSLEGAHDLVHLGQDLAQIILHLQPTYSVGGELSCTPYLIIGPRTSIMVCSPLLGVCFAAVFIELKHLGMQSATAHTSGSRTFFFREFLIFRQHLWLQHINS